MQKIVQKITQISIIIISGILAGKLAAKVAAISPLEAPESETPSAIDGSTSPETLDDAKGLPELYFSIVHPGYTEDGVSNVGELVAISRRTLSDIPIPLAGLHLSYINSSGNEAVLFSFPEHSYMAGETILLRLASSPTSELAHWNYAKTLAFKGGPLALKRGDETIDAVCWTGKEPCLKEFKSASPTVLKRNLETGEFYHLPLAEYEEPEYLPEAAYVEGVPSEDDAGKGAEEVPAPKCRGVTFSEILSYYETSADEQFVEFYNSASEQIFLDGCNLRYKNKLYPLSGMLAPEGYLAWRTGDFRLTKNPTTSNLLELVDADGSTIDSLEYFNGQRKGTSYAFIGYDEKGEELWRTTFAPTPGEPNHYQEYRTCAEGKVINEATGNCVKVTNIGEKICGEGQVLNLLTGRCKKAETAASEKTCAEGYYLNPATNRCKKLQENTGATYEVTPESYEESSTFTAVYLIVGVIVLGLGYIIYEFRGEIRKIWRKMRSKIGWTKKN